MITIQDPVVLGAALATIGGTVPNGVQRVFRAVGVRNPTAGTLTLVVTLAGTEIINRPVLAGKTDLCPELIGRGLNGGSNLQMSGASLTAGFTSLDTLI